MSKRLQSQQISQLRLNLTSPKSLAILEEIDDGEGGNQLSQSFPGESDNLFHTICNGSSANAFAFTEGKHNVLWFLLEEYIIDICDNSEHQQTTNKTTIVKLKEGIVHETHQIVDTLMRAGDAERLLFFRFKNHLLPKVMAKLRQNIGDDNDDDFSARLPAIWDRFWFRILPSMECLLYRIESISNDTIRSASIATFRDHFLLNGKFEDALKDANFRCASIKHMALIVQNLREATPPNRKQLEMERLTAQLFPEYLGLSGLYSEGRLTFKAKEDHVIQERAKPFVPSSPLDFRITSKYRARTKLQRKISLQPGSGSSHFSNAKYLKFMSKLYK